MTQHVLACFGGAGGQHACAIAATLGIRTIFVHRYSGILSAVGIGLAEVVQEAQVGPPALLPQARPMPVAQILPASLLARPESGSLMPVPSRGVERKPLVISANKFSVFLSFAAD